MDVIKTFFDVPETHVSPEGVTIYGRSLKTHPDPNMNPGKFLSKDGVWIQTYMNLCDNPKNDDILVILIHGSFTSYEGYKSNSAFLRKNGYHTSALDFAGHGKSDGKNMTIQKISHLSNILEEFIEHLHEATLYIRPFRKFILFGHSLGSMPIIDLLINRNTFSKYNILSVVLNTCAMYPQRTELTRNIDNIVYPLLNFILTQDTKGEYQPFIDTFLTILGLDTTDVQLSELTGPVEIRLKTIFPLKYRAILEQYANKFWKIPEKKISDSINKGTTKYLFVNSGYKDTIASPAGQKAIANLFKSLIQDTTRIEVFEYTIIPHTFNLSIDNEHYLTQIVEWMNQS